MNFKQARFFPVAFAVWLACHPVSALAQTEQKLTFPIVFTSLADLEKLGFSLVKPTDPADSPWRANACEDRGESDVGYLVSMTNETLARYNERGFSRESLCLAIAAGGPLHDPETGRRMPTFVFYDPAGVTEVLDGRDPETVPDTELIAAGVLTEETLLDVPACFKNGTPHLDCAWRFGERNGRQRTESVIERQRAIGLTLDEVMQNTITEAGQNTNGAEGAEFIKPVGYTGADGFHGTPETFVLPSATLASLSSGKFFYYNWFEFGSVFPHGYGYAIVPSENDKRPTFSIEGILAWLEDKLLGSQVNVDKLEEELNQ